MHTRPVADSAPDPTRCPLCGQGNQCANEVERATGVAQGPCWCTTARFTPALLGQIPADARRAACVCAQCAAEALRQQAVQSVLPISAETGGG